MGHWPVRVWAVLLTEAGERFAFYGCVALLTLYFEQHLLLAPNQAAATFSYFVALCYFTPALASMLADGGLGKVRTIVAASLLFLVGLVGLVLSAADLATTRVSLLLARSALLLVAFGAGGIKACVGVLGAEQLSETHSCNTTAHDGDSVASFFSVFYVFINLGSIGGELLVPAIKQLFGWPAAFAVPPIFLSAALLIFITAASYKGGYNSSQTGARPIQDFVAVSTTAITAGWQVAASRHGRPQATQAKQLTRISLLMAPLPMFWMAWSQTGSTWIQQVNRTSLELFPGWTIEAGQWSVWNPIVVVVAAPLFATTLYPFLGNFVRVSPAFKMVTGMVVAALSFFAAAVVEAAIAHSYPQRISVFWTVPQWILLSLSEVLVSIPGLELAFSEAPRGARTVVQALWLLTSGVGSLLAGIVLDVVSISNGILFSSTGVFLLLFAALFSRSVARYTASNTGAMDSTEEPVSALEPLVRSVS